MNKLTNDQVTDFHRDGFLTIDSLLSQDAVQELRDELDRVMAIGEEGFANRTPRPALIRNLISDAEHGHVFWQIVNIWEVSSAYRRLLYHPFIVRAISQLTGARELMIWHDQLLYKPPRAGGATRWHQDAPLWPIIRPMTPVSAWIALDDTSIENGCMWMVPGSHRWGDQIEFLNTQKHLQAIEEFDRIEPFSPPSDAAIKAVRPQPRSVHCGAVSFHHSLTWHGAPQNLSEQPRRAIAISYMTGEARFVASAEHVMKQYVSLEDGEPMSHAGPHFPVVLRDGLPVNPEA